MSKLALCAQGLRLSKHCANYISGQCLVFILKISECGINYTRFKGDHIANLLFNYLNKHGNNNYILNVFSFKTGT